MPKKPPTRTSGDDGDETGEIRGRSAAVGDADAGTMAGGADGSCDSLMSRTIR
jgi:hypothetical protein